MRPGPVFQLGTGFDSPVVATTDDLTHARGIAAAAHIFQKQGVVEVGELEIGEAKFAAQAHAEQATAQRVPGHRALGKVEREGKRRNDFRERGGTRIHWKPFNDGELKVGSSQWTLPDQNDPPADRNFRLGRFLLQDDSTFSGAVAL
jgi:hypothetical protein